MILHDTAIRDAIDTGKIVVAPDVRSAQIQPASLDVRIGADTTIPPGEPVQVYTLDRVELPPDIAAQLTGRSSVARESVIVHKTAGWIDPGFEGNLLLEMFNFADEPVSFDAGDRVAQLVFMVLTGESHGYDGQYQGQGPDGDGGDGE